MESGSITKDFILKRAKSLLQQFESIPSLPPNMIMYMPRHNKVFYLCKDVAKFHKLIIDNFSEYHYLLESRIPLEEELNSMKGELREHYIEITLKSIIDAFSKTDLQQTVKWFENNTESTITRICTRFHLVYKQLQIRREDRNTLKIKDEYDVQDLLHALLKLYFDDIRTEEWNPSYAGSSTKSDFLIQEYGIIIECKIRTKNNSDKELKEQLIVDKEQYRKNSKCNILYCLIYDPQELIKNTRGFETDISETTNEFICKCFIVPEK